MAQPRFCKPQTDGRRFALLVGACVLVFNTAQAQASRNVEASPGQDLDATLGAARSGDTILLAPGAYPALSVKGVQFQADVTIASRDPAHPATLAGLVVADSRGLRFQNLELLVETPTGERPTIPVRVSNSQDIHFVQLNVHGGSGERDGRAITVRDCDNVSIENSEFHDLRIGVEHAHCDHLTITGSRFHDIRVDAIHGGGSSWVRIANNEFTDFHRQGDPAHGGDHPDAIQFWSRPDSQPAHDIVISDNVMKRGSGTPVQGIFMAGRGPAISDVTISGNTIVGMDYNGIAVSNGRNVTISDNKVEPYADRKSWIRVVKSDGVRMSNNQASKFDLKNNTNVNQ